MKTLGMCNIIQFNLKTEENDTKIREKIHELVNCNKIDKINNRITNKCIQIFSSHEYYKALITLLIIL